MKFYKIMLIALAAVSMVSCDSSDENARTYDSMLGRKINTAADVTVSMPATFSADENEQPFYIPVNVTGETNGKVVVTVKVKELTSTPAGTEPAKAVEHFNITGQTINIAAGSNQGTIEVYPVWVTGEINDDRVFEISIVKAEGATIASNSTCQVTIVNIDDPYTSMCGSWNLTCKNMSTGADATFKVNVKTVEPGSEYYGLDLNGFGFSNSDYLIPFTNFTYDEAAGKGTMEVAYGSMMTDGLAFNYGDPVGVAFPVCMYRTSSGVTMNHQVVVTFDSNYNEIIFPDDCNIYMGLFSTSTYQFTGYGIGYYGNFKMTR